MRRWLSGTAVFFLLLCGCNSSSPEGTLRVQVFTGAYGSIPIHVADEA